MYRVIIEILNDDDKLQKRVEVIDEEFTDAMTDAIESMRQPRLCEEMAKITYNVVPHSPLAEFWEGYTASLEKFIEAADEIFTGWNAHDEKRDADDAFEDSLPS